jgi:hypothetical protein
VAAPVEGERTLGELAAHAKVTLSRLLQQEKELARHELRIEGRKIGFGSVLLLAAAGIGYFAFVLLIVAASFAFAGMVDGATAVGFVAIGMIFAFIAGNAALAGALGLFRVKGPRRTVSTLKDSLRWLRHPTEAPQPGLEALRAPHRD